MNTPSHLGVEHLGDDVLGLGDRRPRLSWQLPSGAARQEAYAIELDGRDLGRIESDASVLVPWPGEPLSSRQRVDWRVKVWTDGGVESGWSPSAWFETGLLDPVRLERPLDRAARGRAVRPRPPSHVPAPCPGHCSARLYATAHGIYEAFLNGRRVGDVELAPGFTSYPSTLHVQVYDVGDLLVAGDNVWEVVLSDGWWRGHTGFFQLADGYGSTLAFLGQLQADELVVTTGPEWESSTGPLLSADLMAGQSEDHRARPVAVATRLRRRPRPRPVWPTRRRRRPAGWRSSAPCRSPAPAPIVRWSTSGRTSTGGSA